MSDLTKLARLENTSLMCSFIEVLGVVAVLAAVTAVIVV